MSDADNVRVAVRIRPLSQSERERGCSEQIQRVPNEPQIIVTNSEPFTFNYVFDATQAQDKLYNDCVLDMLDGLFNGFNATILAYGQTGSGKTYTMGTAFDGDLKEDSGVIPRAMVDLFKRMEEQSNKSEFTVSCSFMELYQEQLYDLLSLQPREQSIVELREDRNGAVIASSLTEEVVKSARDTTDCLMRGSKGRAVGCTAMNQHSSRSHAIFTVTIKATPKNETGIATTSKFRLVDLAGSERSKKTQATGDRFKEGVKINQGLLALGNVISALGSNQGTGFVKYRDSKLTRLLQDSLGGNSITLMIACISPADYNIQETLSTLRYADRARRIKNKPVVNKEPNSNEVKRLNSIIKDLYTRLLEAGVAIPNELANSLMTIVDITPSSSVGSLGEPVDNSAYQELKDKYNESQKQLRLAIQELADKEVRAHAVEASCEKAKSKTHDIMVALNALRGDLNAEVTPEELEEHNKHIQSIKDVVIQLNNEFEEMQVEIDGHASEVAQEASNGELGEDGDLMLEEEDFFTKKQMKYKQELQNIKAELDLKNELRRRVEGNLHKLSAIDDNLMEKYMESENKIKSLEMEKAELEEKLNQKNKDNASAKLAEARRKRLQELEQELHRIKMEKTQQEKLLKQCQGERERVKDLNNQIQKMKESKVKLIRTMRQESDNFRHWKLLREKELAQLKNKDRKLQNELARKEAYHKTRYNVLERKLHEARAAKKRYLERDMAVQKMRLAIHSQKGQVNLEKLITLIEHDVDVITSMVDMENSLKHLTDDRASLISRISELEAPGNANDDSIDKQELLSLKKELKVRNAQISEIEEKIGTVDKDKRIHVICENILKVSDPREAIRRLLKSMVNNHIQNAREILEQKMKCDELQSKLKVAEERCNQVNEQIRAIEMEHEKRVLERENAYEEKIAVLLRQLHNKGSQMYDGMELTEEQQECMRIREEELSKMEAMREELESYKDMVNSMQRACKAVKRKKNGQKSSEANDDVAILEELLSDDGESEEMECDDEADDPDWQKTPIVRKRSKTSQRNTSTESSMAQMDETYVTAASTVNATFPINSTLTVPIKDEANSRRRLGCRCRGTCSNNRCGCHASGEKCATLCRCGDACVNGKQVGVDGGSDESKDNNSVDDAMITTVKSEVTTNENIFKSPPSKRTDHSDFNFTAKDATFITPKIARMSTISFESSIPRKKFFE